MRPVDKTRLHVSTANAHNPALWRTTSAQMKTGEGGYELAIIMSMIAHQRLRGGRFLGEGAGGGVDQDHRAEDDVPAHRRRSEDYEGRAETRR